MDPQQQLPFGIFSSLIDFGDGQEFVILNIGKKKEFSLFLLSSLANK